MPGKLIVTRYLGDKAMALLSELEDWEIIIWNEDRPAPRSWLEENAHGADGFLVQLTDKVDEALIEDTGQNLRVVSTMSVGYDHVDTTALKKRGIKLGFTPGVLTYAVADITVLLVLMATRNAGEGVMAVKTGKWPSIAFGPFVLCGPQLGAGARGTKPYTVGFIGFGRIAQATLKRLSPYGVSRCIYTNSKTAKLPGPLSPTEVDKALAKELSIGTIHAAPLEFISKESDLVIVLAPGGAATYHIVDEVFLRGMKESALLVNTSRGTLVDTDALVKALDERWIWGAGLDVVEGEPNISIDHPLVQHPRAVILPHIGSATVDTREEMARLAVVNVINGLLGRDLEQEVAL